MIIYLCRHGNRGANGSDRERPVELTERGHDQARRLGGWLERQGVEAVYSSPKVRAAQTASPLCDYLGLPLLVWPCLIEHDSYGPLDFNERALLNMRPWPAAGVEVCMTTLHSKEPQEDLSGAYNRAVWAITHLSYDAHYKGTGHVAIFAHDCFNSVFMWAWAGRGCLTEADRYSQGECCVNVLEGGFCGTGGLSQINLKVDPDI